MDLRLGHLKGLLHHRPTDRREPDSTSVNAERLGNEIEEHRQTSLSGGGVRKGLGESLHVLLRGNTEPDTQEEQDFASYFKINIIILMVYMFPSLIF